MEQMQQYGGHNGLTFGRAHRFRVGALAPKCQSSASVCTRQARIVRSSPVVVVPRVVNKIFFQFELCEKCLLLHHIGVFYDKCSLLRILTESYIVIGRGSKSVAVAWRSVGGWRAGRAALLPAAALLVLLLAPAYADVIFRVPEVVVRHTATAKVVGSGGTNKTAHSGADHQDVVEVRYEEYFVEHDVSTSDARHAATTLDLNEDVDDMELLLSRRPQPLLGVRVGCGVCSRKDMEYCESRVLADHCCCDHSSREPFPWLPHTCYAGPELCRPLARDCVQYTRIRDCCCYRPLARRWKGILLKSGACRLDHHWLIPLTALLIAFRTTHRSLLN